MLRTAPAWLTVVVAAALAAGLLAYLSVTPDQGSRIQPDRLGFGTLDRAWLTARIRDAESAHRLAHRTEVRRRVAGTTARRWLAALPGATATSGALATVAVAADDTESADRITELRTWADGIDRAAWTLGPVQVTPVADSDAWVAGTIVRIRLPHARATSRVASVPLTIELAPPATARGRWQLRDAQLDAPRRGLRAWADPVLVGDDHVLAAAATIDAPIARQVAATLSRQLVVIHRRLPASLVRARSTTAWVVDDDTLRPALGRAGGAHDTEHPIARLAATGDVVVERAAWLAASPVQQRAALAHVAFHVATLDSLATLAPAFAEGLADAFAASPTEPELHAVAGLPAPDDAIATLLLAPTTATLDPTDRARAHVLGAWLLATRQLDSVAELVELRAGGVDQDRSIRRSLHATPVGVGARLRGWAIEQLPDQSGAAGADPGTSRADEETP